VDFCIFLSTKFWPLLNAASWLEGTFRFRYTKQQAPPPPARWLLITLSRRSAPFSYILQELLGSALMRKLQLGMEVIFLPVVNFKEVNQAMSSIKAFLKGAVGNGPWPNLMLK
jgi:hypothetical protein